MTSNDPYRNPDVTVLKARIEELEAQVEELEKRPKERKKRDWSWLSRFWDEYDGAIIGIGGAALIVGLIVVAVSLGFSHSSSVAARHCKAINAEYVDWADSTAVCSRNGKLISVREEGNLRFIHVWEESSE